jgi:O-antigen/teichoic acid export membrane protein
MSLKQKALNGVKWTSIGSLVVVSLQLAQLFILTRYLTPSDFGLMAIVSVVIGFSALFMDMGISSAIIHKQNISNRQLSSLYWLNIFAGIILFFVVYFSSSLISEYYNQIKLIPIIQLMATTFFISAIGNQYRILNQKKLRFNLLALVEITAALISFIVAVICAINGFGIYSLVYATLTNVTVSSIILMLKGLKDNKPTFTYYHDDIKDLIGFGLFQMGEKTVNYFNSQFDVILIGKLLGVEALGVYSIAKNLVMKPAQLINPIITKVTFPIMSKVQNDNKQLKNIYLKTINYLCSINFPIYFVIALVAEPLVIILFGSQWVEAILILQILSFYFMFRSICNPVGSLQLAKGRADMGFYWNLGLFSFIPLAIYIGSFNGLVGVAISLLSLQVFLNFPNWYFMVRRLCGADFFEYFSSIRAPLIIAGLASVTGLVVKYFSFFDESNYNYSISILSYFSVYLILIIKFNREFWVSIKSAINISL